MPKTNTQILSKPSAITSGNYKKTTKCFYEQSKLFEAQITELFDDLWATQTAIQNLLWQVSGYYHMKGISQNSILNKKFVDDDDITNRPNLYRTCLERSMDDWKFNLSKNLLTNLFAIFEGWIEMILPKVTRRNIKPQKFQFPDRWQASLETIQSSPNDLLVNTFYNLYKSTNQHYCLEHLNNYLKIYRYFKECRNCIIHNGGIADNKLNEAYCEIECLTPSDIDVIEFPQLSRATEGEILNLNLRGIVGFSQILLKIVATLDIEFIKSDNALTYFIDQVKHFNHIGICAPSNFQKKKNLTEAIAKRAHFIKPEFSEDLCNLFKSNGILR